MKYHDDGQATFYLGDVRDALRELPAESVDAIMTGDRMAPLYADGLRDTWRLRIAK